MEEFLIKAPSFYFKDAEIEYYSGLLKKREYELSVSDSKGRKLSGIVQNLSQFKALSSDFTGDTIKIGCDDEISAADKDKLGKGLMELWPWRKGPFEVFGIFIDTEWKSNLKWDRIRNSISPLKRRHILDIGSSSGYYMFRMLEQEPAFVLGIEPYAVFYYQFNLLRSIAGLDNIHTLPIRFEEMYIPGKKFNTIFCMGILYHRISPVEFLKSIRLIMAADGELVLETLILEGDSHTCLYPAGRYAKMQNVYFIPTLPVLESWLKKAGFRETLCIDISVTTEAEQRETEWVKTESLKDFLDPDDRSRTIEGYQAPLRAVVIAKV
jgi:tRNA (mo5U34)-methyltransferase